MFTNKLFLRATIVLINRVGINLEILNQLQRVELEAMSMAAKSEREEELEQRIKELENEICSLRGDVRKRAKIAEMSAEVVDSNPYR